MSETDPRWDLLPHQPEAFFGLEDGYDLRELKRRYNALLLRFKPEKHPDEFQRIRAAYETLNDALRYGERPHRLPHATFDWTANERPAASDAGDGLADLTAFDQAASTGAAVEAPPPLWERLETVSPRDLYEELKERGSKSPHEYYALAVLSDRIESDPLAFARWLLAGLGEHREEPGLFQLLREHLARDVSPADAPALLEAVSQVVRSDRFYYLTEPLWDRLMREAPFATFRRTLEACEANLLDHRFHHQVTFRLHMLRPALWKADDDWLEQTFAEVEEQPGGIPHWVEEELILLDTLRLYRDHRSKFLRGGSLRAEIDRAIVDYCTCEETEADRRFLECQHVLATRGEELLRDFADPEEGFAYVLLAWEQIADDVAGRVGEEPAALGGTPLKRRVGNLADEMIAEGERRGFLVIYYCFGLVMVLGLLLAAGLVLFQAGRGVVYLFSGFQVANALWSAGKAGGLMIGILVWAMGWALIDSHLVRRYYRTTWRRMVLRFLESARYSPGEIADELKTLDGQKVRDRDIAKAKAIAELVRKDPALAFYATAQRMLVESLPDRP